MIPFSPPNIRQEAIDEVVDTLRSGWITTGPKTKKFEKEITKYCGHKKTLCLNSATFGLELILRWFGVGFGDEVIVPAYTYCASANVIIHCGATPVLVDSNAEDFTINVKAVKNAITKRTKAIIPVDIAGLPCDYESLNKMVESPQIKKIFDAKTDVQKKMGRILILSDAAHSFGALYKNKRSGSLTDVSVFSFHAVKNLTTAEGGAIALNLPRQFNCDDIYTKLNIMSLHGQSKDALAKTEIGNWKYDVLDAGYKGNMTDIQASLGLIDLKYYDSETLARRKMIMETYNEVFSNYEIFELPIIADENRVSSCHIYPLRIKNITEKQRDEIIQNIFEKGVSVNVHFQPLPLLTAYKSRGYKMADYPTAYDNYSREISLPVYYNLTDEQLDEVLEAVVFSTQKNLLHD